MILELKKYLPVLGVKCDRREIVGPAEKKTFHEKSFFLSKQKLTQTFAMFLHFKEGEEKM